MAEPRRPQQYQVVVHRPDDFDAFWDGVLEELRSWPAEAKFVRDEMRSTARVDVYDVGYTSLDGVRLSAWYACPRPEVVEPPYPGLVIVPGYISDPVIPKEWAELGYGALAVAPRGKVRSRSQVDAHYPGLLVESSVDRASYGYRAFYADACRAVDVLAEWPQVDRDRIGVHGSSQGGALTIVLASLRRDLVSCGAAGAPYLCGFLDAAKLTTSYPYHEITEHLRAHPEERSAIEETLPYFDGINFAPAITAPMLVYIGLEDDVCPPETGFAVHAAMQCDKQLITMPHCAHDAGAHWVSAQVERFLAEHLEPVAVRSSTTQGRTVITPPGQPAEFDEYWRAVDQQLAATPARPTLEVDQERSSADYTLYRVRLTGVDGYRLFAYFSVPVGDGPFPALYELPRYGSVNNVPDHLDRLRFVVLTLMHRGQRLADSPFVAPYPGLLTLGIEDPATYIYRFIAADCLRGAEFLLGRPEVDPSRVAVSGDDLALITAARRAGFSHVRYATPMLYRALEARHLTTRYPIEELNDLLRLRPELESEFACSLALLDPLFHAPDVQAKTIVSLGAAGSSSGEDFLGPLLGELGGPVERYRLTFAGGTDHDRLDALLAGELGASPMSRFARTIG